ncbi:MAG: cache domain-containing protein [Methyloceanibacter sp.]
MFRKLVFAAASASALVLATMVLAETAQYGTAQEARALLDRAVAALKADGRKAISRLDSDSFRDRDLYVFCSNASDSVSVVHPTDKGVRLYDYDFGKEVLANATEGEVKEVTYEWRRPGADSDAPVKKTAYYTKVGDLICGSGYYVKP